MSLTSVSGEIDMFTPTEAREATDRAKAHAQRLWLELYELRQRQAHLALGYTTAEAYWQDEFGLSRRTAQQYIAAAKVKVAVESHQVGEDMRANARTEGPATEHVARVFTPLVDRDDDVIPEAWAAVVEEHNQSDKAAEPITAREARTTLMAKGYLPDTRPGGAAKPGWFELLGNVGDALIAASKALDKAQAAITRRPNAAFRSKAGEYAEWADTLAERLHGME